MKRIKIRDLRIKEKFQIDDFYLNGYAKICGYKGTIVYISLCRHADKDQYSFPSIKRMAEQHKVSRDVIIDGIKLLQESNIIHVEKQARSKHGTWKCNGYTLIDKSEWNPPSRPQLPGTESILATSPSRLQLPDRVDSGDTKDTHIKDTHKKDTQSFSFEEIWDKYPNKVGKKKAEKYFNASIKTEKAFKEIGVAVEKYLQSGRVLKGYIQDGSTWFNNWRDWINYVEPKKEGREEISIKKSPSVEATDKYLKSIMGG